MRPVVHHIITRLWSIIKKEGLLLLLQKGIFLKMEIGINLNAKGIIGSLREEIITELE